jgi:hypothetical protein
MVEAKVRREGQVVHLIVEKLTDLSSELAAISEEGPLPVPASDLAIIESTALPKRPSNEHRNFDRDSSPADDPDAPRREGFL